MVSNVYIDTIVELPDYMYWGKRNKYLAGKVKSIHTETMIWLNQKVHCIELTQSLIS